MQPDIQDGVVVGWHEISCDGTAEEWRTYDFQLKRSNSFRRKYPLGAFQMALALQSWLYFLRIVKPSPSSQVSAAQTLLEVFADAVHSGSR
jgi:hypothetical protein